jgi:hypothetical protein
MNVLLKTGVRLAKQAGNDTVDHIKAKWPELTFAIILGLLMPFDLYLALTGRPTISERVWNEAMAFPTIIAFGALLSIGIGWLLRKSWPAVLIWGMLAGHLFMHW